MTRYLTTKSSEGEKLRTLDIQHDESEVLYSEVARLNDVVERNRRLPDFKRIDGFLTWEKDFPRTASMKIKRNQLAEQIRSALPRTVVQKI